MSGLEHKGRCDRFRRQGVIVILQSHFEKHLRLMNCILSYYVLFLIKYT